MGCSVSLVGQNLSTSVVLSAPSSPYEYNEKREILSNGYPNQRSALKMKIKSQFFNGLNNTGLPSLLVKNQAPQPQASRREKTWRNFTGKSNKSVKLNVSRELGSYNNLEKPLNGRITASLSKLSVQEQGSLPSTSNLHTNVSKEFSVVYISDFNSNFSDNDSSNQEHEDGSINGLIKRKIPTSVLMQDSDVAKHRTHKDGPLSLASEEIALAVHQEFFNDFEDICDDDFLLSG